MKAPVLVVRTVSVEKLSPVLDACQTRWPQHPLLVVTNAARGSELRTDTRIAELIHYATGAEGFRSPIPCDHVLEAVVVPVGNRGGSGYGNVLRACQHLRSRTWFLASYARELRELSAGAWTWRWQRELGFEAPARWLARLWKAWILRGM